MVWWLCAADHQAHAHARIDLKHTHTPPSHSSGSGCATAVLARTLTSALGPRHRTLFWTTDLNPKAARATLGTGAANGVAPLEVVQGDLLANFQPRLLVRFGLILVWFGLCCMVGGDDVCMHPPQTALCIPPHLTHTSTHNHDGRAASTCWSSTRPTSPRPRRRSADGAFICVIFVGLDAHITLSCAIESTALRHRMYTAASRRRGRGARTGGK